MTFSFTRHAFIRRFASEQTLRRARSLGKRLLLIVVALSGAAASLWGYHSEAGKERDRQLSAFETEALNQSHAIESYLNFTLSALPVLATSVATGLRAIVPEKSNVARVTSKYWDHQLREPMQNTFRNYHAIRTLAWIVHNPADQHRLFPIGYTQYSPFYGAGATPFARTDNFADNPIWLEAMRKAVDGGHIMLSAPTQDSVDILAFMPVFRNNVYTTRQQRQTNLTGFIVARIDRSALMEIGLQRQNLSGKNMVVSVHDITDSLDKIKLYLNGVIDPAPVSDEADRQSRNRVIEVGGRTWMLRFDSTMPLHAMPRSPTPWVILCTGLLLTAAISIFLIAVMTRNTRIENLISKRTDELNEANRQLRDSELLLVQAEKMSALGQMVAGIAHEINTPLGFAKANLQLMEEHVRQLLGAFAQAETTLRTAAAAGPALAPLQAFHTEGLSEELAEIIGESLEGIARISGIVAGLKDFSRMDRLTVDDVDLHQCIDSTLMIAYNAIKHKAEVVRQYGDIPPIHCAASQINQVLLNIITNAAQAMEDFGSIVITTSLQEEHVHIVIQDNGKGMSREIKKRIFEPFYTTKEVGEGTGLGLAICEKIVRQHRGRILVQSMEGMGTTFTIVLPIRQPPAATVAEAA